ncbi:hypothetical protein F383_07051 [Gossypium arboreum]|uniref:Uncharacterized protein n=1 Tax=Gossypium arboreum TaxID=29729 RepID=A0A0B0PJT0_GOSAR|nr:hypothetical protein F383_07051 [Gossypium arboreum]
MSLGNHVLCDLMCYVIYVNPGAGHVRPTDGWVVWHVLQIPGSLCEQPV